MLFPGAPVEECRGNEITGRKQALLQNNISKFQKLLILRSRAKEEEKKNSKAKRSEGFISGLKV